MLGRKTYTQTEVDHARTAVAGQAAAYVKLARAVEVAADPRATSALKTYEPLFFNNMVLVLDRYFVHRMRLVAGRDGNPLNEVGLLAASLTKNDGVLLDSAGITHVPATSVLGLQVGDRIALGASQFDRLVEAFFTELVARFR